MTWGSSKLHFTYDSIGPASVTYNGNRYFYLKTGGTMASTIGAANPLRYRGYVYDSETGLYYNTNYVCVSVDARVVALMAFAAFEGYGWLLAYMPQLAPAFSQMFMG